MAAPDLSARDAAPAPRVGPLLRLAVFDMDGTLIDSQAFIVEAMETAFRRAGLTPPDASDTLSIIGLSLHVAIARLGPDLPPQRLAEVEALYRECFVEIRARAGGEAGSPLYPGAREALARLADRPEVLLGVATGKARRGLDHALDAHDLRPFFQTLQTADLHPSKPHPAMLFAALAETGVEARNAAMIGDTEYDMEMARAAGMTAIAVTWGYHPEDRLRAAGAQHVIRDFQELDHALARSWEEV